MNTCKNKHSIKRCFNRACETYDLNCHVQIQAGQFLIDKLKNYQIHYDQALDVGCGTGMITKRLLEELYCNHLLGIDFSNNLLEIAQGRLVRYNADLIEFDFDQFLCQTHQKRYDLIFSNMSLQWSDELALCIKQIYNHLSPNGIFAFSIPLQGTFFELNSIYSDQLHAYHDAFQMLSDFNVLLCEHESIVHSFDSVQSALQSIKMVGANSLSCVTNQALHGRSFLKNFFKKKYPPYSLTYHVGYFIINKLQKCLLNCL